MSRVEPSRVSSRVPTAVLAQLPKPHLCACLEAEVEADDDDDGDDDAACLPAAGCEQRPTSHKIGAQFQLVDVLCRPTPPLLILTHLLARLVAINFLAPVGRVELSRVGSGLPLLPPSSLVDSEVHGLALCLIWRSKCSTSGRAERALFLLAWPVLWPKI